jgi:protocatechuate 3,4-dioxygenase beta subunit
MEGNVASAARKPTADQVQGPFYPVIKPVDQDADLTVIRGKQGKAQGQVIYLTGQVLNLKGEPIPGVRIEVWQANAFGRYTHPNDSNPAPLDPSFEGYGVQATGSGGRYRFKTIKPAGYPVPDGWTRAPHIHFCFTSRITQLITQMYFEGEPLNETDLLLNNTPNKESLITKLMPPAPDMESDALMAVWDVVLGET